ncbi:MAG: phosphoribosylamine--glycine ligase [Candidatus Woykebacteria bacterium]
MKVLVIGGGAREHALVSKYIESSKVRKVYSIPGNGLMDYKPAKPVKIYPSISPTDKSSIWEVIKREKIYLVDVAQDDPLAEGMVDFLEEKGVATFGPTKLASQIEWSKEWSRNFMREYSLPIPHFASFTKAQKAKDYLKKLPQGVFFVKASGLAAGKGAIRANDKSEVIEAIDQMKSFGKSGETFLIEEALVGEEVSVYAISDGKNFKILKAAQDNKTVNNFDEGPNTGGIGANAPALLASNNKIQKKVEEIIVKTIKGMEKEGRLYKGILYLGLIIDKKKNLKIIEFNARWGDPEAQVVLPGIKNDYLEVATSVIDGELDKLKILEDKKTRVCIVGASRGYPGDYSKVKNKQIFGIDEALKTPGVSIYGAGLRRVGTRFFANGGRLFNVVGEGKDVVEARARAYQAISLINIQGNNLHYRTDIGWRDVERISAYA